MKLDEAFNLVASDLTAVENFFKEDINTPVNIINETILHILSSGGKRLRPIFLALAARLCGYKPEEAEENLLPIISGIIEYIHTATLLHDDVIDGSLYRRGRKTANNTYGNDIAILCGDYLYSKSYITLTKYGKSKIQTIIATAALTMSQGEVVQIIKTGNINLKFEEYLEIITSKTAILFMAACEIGAELASATEEKALALKNFAYNLGLAFQMADDILDYVGNPEKMGKANGTDLLERKLTLPIIKLLEEANSEDRKIVADIFSRKNSLDGDLQSIKSLFEKYDIISISSKIADSYIENCLSSLNIFEDSPYKEALKAIALAMVSRDK